MECISEHILEGTPSDIVSRYESLSDLSERLDFGQLDRNVVVIDTETTGFSFSHDELIQIAAARIERGQIVDWYVTFVNPGKAIPEDIVHLTGIQQEDVANAPYPDEALKKLVEFAGNAAMVAHNVGFDKTFVTKHPSGYPLLDNVWIDTLDLSRIALPRLKSHRLIDLVRTFGAPTSTHRADDDVAATCVIYRILLAAVASMPFNLVKYIGSMVDEETWSTSFVFKYLSDHWDSIHNPEDRLAEDAVETATVSEDASSESILKESPSRTYALSVLTLRKRRMITLPVRKARRDADELIGELEYPTPEETRQAFSDEGVLGAIYDDYETRSEQQEMALAINEALGKCENLVVEAGTGVGKSMAYLVPMVQFALKNDVSVGVATKTNSLLDQLVYKELPALAEALDETMGVNQTLTWASLKGMSHYLCLRKVSRLADSGPGMREVTGTTISQAPALAGLLSFVEQTEFDDIDSLKIDYRAIPRYLITTKSSECLRRKCPYFGRLCFVHGARRRAETADVVVTNHSLLFCDVEADGGLLPPVRHWVVDEAHSAESEARAAFAEAVDSESISRIAGVVSDSAGSRNVFERAERSVSKIEAEQLTLFFGLISKARAAGNDFSKSSSDYLLRIKDLLYFDPVKRSKRGQSYDQVDIWINNEVRHTDVFGNVAVSVSELIEKADKLIKAASELVAYLEGIEEAAVAQREIASCVMDLREIRNAAELIFEKPSEAYAYQVSLQRKKDRYTDKAQALLLDVGDKLNQTFYARTHSVVYASATLTVGNKFDSFNNSMGLNKSEFSTARVLQLDSSYDFDNNMIVYVVSDMPEPNDPEYPSALNKLLLETHRAQNGSMLTLFTNRREMDKSFKEVSAQLKQDGLRVICQKYGLSVKGLKDEFLADEHLSLFALKSFWEGFDAPGATLKGVIIPKLPFARPTDPLYCERASRDDRAWWRYVLPQAVIETKQAAGRLIRKADDHGVLILADKRLITKAYGKTFLSSLQSKTVRVCTMEEIANSLKVFRKWY